MRIQGKRIIALLTAIMLMISLIPISVVAADTVTISADSVTGIRGDTVNVDIRISSGSKMQACSFDLEYDKSSLEIVSAEKGSVLSATPIVNTNVAGKVIFSYASTTPVNNSGVVLSLKFKILDNAQYGYNKIKLTVNELADGSFANLSCTVKDGYIDILAPQLEAPDNIDFRSLTDTSVEMMWTGNDEATGYNLYLNGTKVNDEPITDNIYTLYDLTQNTRYEVQVSNLHYTVESVKSSVFEFTTNKALYDVIFVDWNYNNFDIIPESVLKYTVVEHGATAEPPENPTREGYKFVGWDTEFANVTSDIVIQAVYETAKYTVRYLDDDGTVLSTQIIEHGNDAQAPKDPSKEGMVFAGWDNDGKGILKDTDINALYRSETYTVIFLDENGEILQKHEFVPKGETITPPEAPSKLGYSFIGWDKPLENITSNLTVSPVFEINKYTVTFKGVDGAVIKTINNVEHGSAVVAPTPPDVQGYIFVGWDKEFNNVTSDLTVNGLYEINDVNAPKISIDSKRGVAGNRVSVNVSIANNPGIASATLRVKFNTDVLTLVEVNDLGKLGTQVHKPQLGSPYTLTWANDTINNNIIYNGDVATLVFEIADDAEVGNYPIELSYDYDNYDIYNVDAQKVMFHTINGSISVVDVIVGDVNSDGLVNNLDRMVLTRYLADWDDYTEENVNLIAADVNGDNLVNNLDRMVLTRHLGDWEGYESLPYSN